MEMRLAKATNNFLIAKSDGHSSCFPFWSMWIRGPCWLFPSSWHCLVSWLSGCTFPWVFFSHHTPYGLSVCPHSSSSNPWNETFPGLHSSALRSPYFFLMLQQLWVTIFSPQGFNTHLLKTEGFVFFKSVTGGRVSLTIFLPLNTTYL